MSEARSAVDRSTNAARSTGIGGAVGSGANARGVGFSYFDTAPLSALLARCFRWLWSRAARIAR